MAGNSNSGRRAEREKPKLQPLNLRTDPELRELIEDAADRNGRSLTQEVERRLRMSFIMDERQGGRHNNTFVNLLGAVIGVIEEQRGTIWLHDPETWEVVRAATLRLLSWNRPHSAEDDAMFALGEAAREASDKLEAARSALDDFRNSRGVVSKHGIDMTIRTPVRRGGGMFGGGAATIDWLDPRRDWSDEDRQEEQRLEAELAAANLAYQQASAPLMSMVEGQGERRGRLEKLGREEAENWFSLIGPRRGTDGT